MGIALQLLQLFPLILQAIVATETAFGPTVPGPVKKQIVLNSVGTAAKLAGQPIPIPVVKAVGTLIDTTVASLNGQGLLSKPAPAPAPSAPKK